MLIDTESEEFVKLLTNARYYGKISAYENIRNTVIQIPSGRTISPNRLVSSLNEKIKTLESMIEENK